MVAKSESIVFSAEAEEAFEALQEIAQAASLTIVSCDERRDRPDKGWVSATVEGEYPYFSRWLLYCALGEVMSVDLAATVLGLAITARPSVVVLTTLGSISREAQHFIETVNNTSRFRFVGFDRDDFNRKESTPSALTALLWQRLKASATTN